MRLPFSVDVEDADLRLLIVRVWLSGEGDVWSRCAFCRSIRCYFGGVGGFVLILKLASVNAWVRVFISPPVSWSNHCALSMS